MEKFLKRLMPPHDTYEGTLWLLMAVALFFGGVLTGAYALWIPVVGIATFGVLHFIPENENNG